MGSADRTTAFGAISSVGASGRARPLPPGVADAGPPPAPVLGAPWSAAPAAEADLDLLAGWMAAPHVADRWRQDWSATTWGAELRAQRDGEHSRPWILALDGEPTAYVEVYRVARDVIAEHWAVEAHDLGVHVAIGAADDTGRGLGTRLLAALAVGLRAADPQCRRVVGDPEVGHAVARRCFAAAGYALAAEVDLPHKRAAVMVHA